ncbi:DUF6261 family protein [Kordia zhangzhouensis]|uniref:DUF6261 family protein n=1 Tax=Kordia zhangzhouensis TaxID=1620405 RepID=UPI0006294A84|nr:DUF6261 family protein [Kordia zhangzhouensis]
MKDIVKLINQYDVAALGLTAERAAMASQVANLVLAFEVEQEPVQTAALQALDAQRDDLYKGIRYVLKGYTYHIDSIKKEAAKSLLFHFETYGKNVHRMPYQQETALIANMMEQWQTDTQLQEAVTMLHLSDWVQALETVNREFGQLYVARVSEIATNDIPTFTSLRDGATAVYRTLVERLEAFVTLNTHDDHQKLHVEIHELVRQYNQVVKTRRKKRSEKG